MPASADVGIFLDVAPPDPRREGIPAHRPGHVWQPGYWDWRNGRYVWVRGYWVRERPGMYWHPNRWEHRDGRLHFVAIGPLPGAPPGGAGCHPAPVWAR